MRNTTEHNMKKVDNQCITLHSEVSVTYKQPELKILCQPYMYEVGIYILYLSSS